MNAELYLRNAPEAPARLNPDLPESPGPFRTGGQGRESARPVAAFDLSHSLQHRKIESKLPQRSLHSPSASKGHLGQQANSGSVGTAEPGAAAQNIRIHGVGPAETHYLHPVDNYRAHGRGYMNAKDLNESHNNNKYRRLKLRIINQYGQVFENDKSASSSYDELAGQPAQQIQIPMAHSLSPEHTPGLNYSIDTAEGSDDPGSFYVDGGEQPHVPRAQRQQVMQKSLAKRYESIQTNPKLQSSGPSRDKEEDAEGAGSAYGSAG